MLRMTYGRARLPWRAPENVEYLHLTHVFLSAQRGNTCSGTRRRAYCAAWPVLEHSCALHANAAVPLFFVFSSRSNSKNNHKRHGAGTWYTRRPTFLSAVSASCRHIYTTTIYLVVSPLLYHATDRRPPSPRAFVSVQYPGSGWHLFRRAWAARRVTREEEGVCVETSNPI